MPEDRWRVEDALDESQLSEQMPARQKTGHDGGQAQSERHHNIGRFKTMKWKLAMSLDLPFLGAIPLDPSIARLSDQGRIEEYSSPTIAGIVDELRTRAAKHLEQLTQGLPIAWSIEPAH